MPRFASWTVTLRRTSNVDRFPFTARTVTLLRISATGVVEQATSATEKRALLTAAGGKDLVLAAWPGEWRQDIFVVDDLRAARAAVG